MKFIFFFFFYQILNICPGTRPFPFVLSFFPFFFSKNSLQRLSRRSDRTRRRRKCDFKKKFNGVRWHPGKKEADKAKKWMRRLFQRRDLVVCWRLCVVFKGQRCWWKKPCDFRLVWTVVWSEESCVFRKQFNKEQSVLLFGKAQDSNSEWIYELVLIRLKETIRKVYQKMYSFSERCNK